MQFNRFAVRRVPKGICPCLFPALQLGGRAETFRLDEMLKGGKPVLIIAVSVVDFAARRGLSNFIRQRFRPFLPGEMPLIGQLHRESECLGLPGFGEEGAPIVARRT